MHARDGWGPEPDIPRTVLVIAGSDSSGGAGIQADVKTLMAHGVHAVTALTAITAQSSLGVVASSALAPHLVRAQIDAVASDAGASAVKIGMLATAGVVVEVATALRCWQLGPLVLDPVLAATGGQELLDAEGVRALRDELLPLATVLTPNVAEAQALTGTTVRSLQDCERAARTLHALGPAWVLVKGGHLGGAQAIDVLFDGENLVHLPGPRLSTAHTHGTGCTLASSIAAHLSAGFTVPEAVAGAKRFVSGAIAGGYPVGKGPGPVDPAWRCRAGGALRLGGPSHPTAGPWPLGPSPYEG